MKTEKPTEILPGTSSDFITLFGVGVGGWLLGTLVLFGLSWRISEPNGLPNAMMWTVSQSWVAFLFGMVVLAAYGLVRGRGIGKALTAYVAPVLLLAAIAGICLLIYPDRSLREDLLTSLPVVSVFYVFGLLWMKARSGVVDSSQFSRAIIPGLLGGIVVLGFVAIPVFGSDAFRYRDAFDLKISSLNPIKGAVLTEGVLVIRKVGNYDFSAPLYTGLYSEDSDEIEPVIEMGEITWGAGGAPTGDSPGEYPFKIVWRRTRSAGPDAVAMLSPYEDYVCLEVRNIDEENRLVHTMEVPIDEPAME